MRKELVFLLLLLMFNGGWLFSQNNNSKTYFDKSGKACSAEISYYYHVQSDTNDFFRSYYSQNDHRYFEGNIKSASATDENLNIYKGNCNWFYKNGNPKASRTFNEKGVENGFSKYYYESGKIWKEIEYENGRVKGNVLTEYNEDGTRNKLFEEDFNNNDNEWDLFMSDKSSSKIANGQFEIVSTSKEGTSRYINHIVESDEFTIEAVLNTLELKENEKVGIIYGFKDWQNYHYFAISRKNIYIGSFYEGVKSSDIDGMYCSAIVPQQNNTIKIICNGEKDFFSVNGEIQYKYDKNRLYGNNFGFILSGVSKLKVDKFIIKELNVSSSGSIKHSVTDKDVKATGSGIIFNSEGYILTNYHVIENSNHVIVEVNDHSNKLNYNAEVVINDKENDLAVLKIKDKQFTGITLDYAFKESGLIDVGSGVFTIGYPHALSGMGKEAKFTDGKISSKTGYNGSVNSFQTTIPVQPGNSGGPVFNNEGQLVGVINATIKEADNVSYAIKLNYIKNLIEMISEKVDLPNNSRIQGLSLEEKLKVLTNYVVLIKVK